MLATVSCPTLGTKDAAEFLGVKDQTLAKWRCTKEVCIPFIRVGRTIRYRISDLERFLESNTVDAGTSA